MAAENTTRPRSCRLMKSSRQAGLSGDRLAPVDQAAAFGEARQGRADMTQRGVGDPPLDMRGGREGRVHQNDSGAKPHLEMIVDVGPVEAGNGNARKQLAEKSGPRFRKPVEDKRRAGNLGEDGEEA